MRNEFQYTISIALDQWHGVIEVDKEEGRGEGLDKIISRERKKEKDRKKEIEVEGTFQ